MKIILHLMDTSGMKLVKTVDMHILLSTRWRNPNVCQDFVLFNHIDSNDMREKEKEF